MQRKPRKDGLAAISIGMPVYNGGESLVHAVESILNQTLDDFELIISDNGSTDSTFEICEKFAKRDSRIKLFRQTENIGPVNNFLFVFKEAQSDFFCWAAADDLRSPDFLEVNYRFLSENSDYVASCSPNCFIGDEVNLTKFEIVNNRLEDRVVCFLENGWNSHGVFYSLFRREALNDSKDLGSLFFASDWYVDLCLLSHGKFNRSKAGVLALGRGCSMEPDFVSGIRSNFIEYFIPFRELWKAIRPMATALPIASRTRIFFIFCSLNFSVFRGNLVYSLKRIGLKH